MFNVILWIAHSGAAWRDIPERFGSWKTIYIRFYKWCDVETLANVCYELNTDADFEISVLIQPVIKAHQHT